MVRDKHTSFHISTNHSVIGDRALEYFRIKNWEKYHHRDHKKSMPWIKLDAFIFEDAKFISLSDNSKLVWIGLLTLSAKNGNNFVWSSSKLRSKLGLRCFVKLQHFLDLGLIEPCLHDGRRADDAPSPRLEEIRGDKRREEVRGVDSISQKTHVKTEWKTPQKPLQNYQKKYPNASERRLENNLKVAGKLLSEDP